jgi:hypothetical protein
MEGLHQTYMYKLQAKQIEPLTPAFALHHMNCFDIQRDTYNPNKLRFSILLYWHPINVNQSSSHMVMKLLIQGILYRGTTTGSVQSFRGTQISHWGLGTAFLFMGPSFFHLFNLNQ